MKRYTTYLLKQFFLTTTFIAVALVGAVWMTQSLRYIDFVMARGLSLLTFLKLVGLLLPNLISIVLPIALFMGAMFVLNKLYNDRELVVLRALGVSNTGITRPFLIVAVGVLAIVYGMNFYVNPSSTQQYKNYKATLRNNMTSFVMQPGEFVTFKNITFYVKSRYRGGQLSGIFVYDARKQESPFSITAERGIVLETDEGLKLVLFKGTRQDLDSKTHQPNILNFDQYSVEIQNPELSGDRDPKPAELSFMELMNPPAGLSSKLAHKYKIEAHQRILLPLNVLPFVLIALAVFLLGDYDRRGRSRQMIVAGTAAIAFEVIILALLNGASKNGFWIIAAYGFLIASSLTLYYLIYNNRHISFTWGRR